MARSAATPCKTIVCPNLCFGAASEFQGYCPDCAQNAAVEYETKRRQRGAKRRLSKTPHDQFYATRAWRNCRTSYIKHNPLCVSCESFGRIRPGVDVDHIIERKDGGADYDWANLQTLCKSCHSTKTIAERRKRNKT